MPSINEWERRAYAAGINAADQYQLMTSSSTVALSTCFWGDLPPRIYEAPIQEQHTREIEVFTDKPRNIET